MRMIEADKVPPLIRLLFMNNKYAEAIVRDVKAIIDRNTIEAEPVRHGEWVLGDVEPGYCTPGGNRPWICSECGQVVSWMLGKPKEKYCPNCGAKMRGDTDE